METPVHPGSVSVTKVQFRVNAIDFASDVGGKLITVGYLTLRLLEDQIAEVTSLFRKFLLDKTADAMVVAVCIIFAAIIILWDLTMEHVRCLIGVTFHFPLVAL